jgi:hypothetical protein
MIEDENDLSEIVDELDEAELKRKIRELEGKVTGGDRKRDQKTSRKQVIEEFKPQKPMKRTGTQDAADRMEKNDMRTAQILLEKMQKAYTSDCASNRAGKPAL